MPDFLLELLSEEIPARMQAKACKDLQSLFEAEIEKAGLKAEAIETHATPRRLALIARGLPTETEAVSEELKGPRTSAPPQALEGFLRKTGLTQDQLEDRDGIWFAAIEKPCRATADVLAEAIPSIVRAFPWPKSMRWGEASISTESPRWVRPLQGIVALLGDKVVEFEIAGIESGAATVGHRFHHPGVITIGGAGDYAEKLRACHVILDSEERRRIIAEGAAKAAEAAGLILVEDEGLLHENAGLTEWPVPLVGSFDPAFLQVPHEVIQLTMRTNQKYFACVKSSPERGGGPAAKRTVEGAQGTVRTEGPLHHQPAAGGPPPRTGEELSQLAPNFVCVANIEASDGGAAIVAGNEKVLAARLSDAKFFWEQDLKIPLEEQAKKLDQIVFHEKLGTVADKVDRVAKLARWLVEEGIVGQNSSPGRGGGPAKPVEGAHLSAASEAAPLHQTSSGPPPRTGEDQNLAALAERAARLCKADLVTGMVGEFPELQGIIGGHLARAQDEPDEIANAIRDHYKPVGQGDEVPTAPVTVAVSLADKLDTLVGFFAVYERPTSSRDPFALRRAALGIIELIVTRGVRCSLRHLISEAYKLLTSQLVESSVVVDWDVENDQNHRRATASNFTQFTGRLAVLKERPIDWIPESREEYYPASQNLSQHLLFVMDAFGSSVEAITDFLLDRVEERQRRLGRRYDLIRAAMARKFWGPATIDVFGYELTIPRTRQHNWDIDDDLVRLLARVKALQAFVETPEGADLLAGYKRAANILKKEDWAGPATDRHPGLDPGSTCSSSTAGEGKGMLDQVRHDGKMEQGQNKTLSYTPEKEEAALTAALDSAEPSAAAAVEKEDFEGAMAALASLRAPVDSFFDKVIVNDPDQDKRKARLALLARMRDAVHRVADFSKIEG